VRIEGRGALPTVEPVRTGQFDWQQWEPRLAVSSDIDELVRRLEQIGSGDVLQLRAQGTCDLAGHNRLNAALDAARARARALVWDGEALRLEPTEDDIQALHADGFVGEALQALREQQGGADAELARDALLTLARILGTQAGAAA